MIKFADLGCVYDETYERVVCPGQLGDTCQQAHDSCGYGPPGETCMIYYERVDNMVHELLLIKKETDGSDED